MRVRQYRPSKRALLRFLAKLTAEQEQQVGDADIRLILASKAVIQAAVERSSDGSDASSGLPGRPADGVLDDLQTLCTRSRPSFEAQRARATAFLAWDDGYLAARAAEEGFLEDRLLWAIIADLAALS